MRAFKRTCGLLVLAAVLGFGTQARAATAVPQSPGTYAVGDAELAPGMTLQILRPHGARSLEVGRMRVLAIRNDEVQLELLSGTSKMKQGDSLQVEAAPVSGPIADEAPRDMPLR